VRATNRIKITLIGGGGVRSPLFVSSVLRRTHTLNVDELWLLDVNEERLRLFGTIAQRLVQEAASSVRIVPTTDARAALSGADHIVTTIRVAGEEGRVLDEAIAVQHGVLGQETTGPGGFAMAARSIPVALMYAQLAAKVAPGAWTFNFTNPAGLVTQALRDRGFDRTIGICDGANAGTRAVSDFLAIPISKLRAEVFGLNHLSWTRRVECDGRDLLAPLLRDRQFHAATTMGLFDWDLVMEKSLWINEYLYYFYYAKEAVEQQTAAATRARQIKALNNILFRRLRQIDPERDPVQAIVEFRKYQEKRRSTYMRYPRFGVPEAVAETPRVADQAGGEADDGYAGVALDALEAIAMDHPLATALNVPNEEAIDGLEPGDVVEISSLVDGKGVRPIALARLPRPEVALAQAVKAYERLAVDSILRRSRSGAVAALLAHPLVPSYHVAEALVDAYLGAHKESLGTWT
jgi:6-phospho-beta-glucosidase